MNHVASPDISDPGIERQIQAKGLTAPRITPADIQANITHEFYFTAADGVDGADLASQRAASPTESISFIPLNEDNDPAHTTLQPLMLLTFCVLVLRNGFTVVGESACASPENFSAEIGRNVAKANAVNKIWPLMGYALKNDLYQAKLLKGALS